MSRQKNVNGDNGLPLPSPTSPPALDDKILGYARDQAEARRKAGSETPARTGLLGHPWATGLATAGVVAIALFISEPQQPSPALQSTPMATDKAANKPAAASRARVAEDFSAEMDMAGQAPKEKTAQPQLLQRQETIAGAPAEEVLVDSAEPGEREDNEEREDTAQTLTRCAQLLREGHTDEAEALYRQLRKRCPECQLPESLQAALAKKPEDY